MGTRKRCFKCSGIMNFDNFSEMYVCEDCGHSYQPAKLRSMI